MSEGSNIFDREAEKYDAWFDSPDGRMLFENELAAVKLFWRPARGIEVRQAHGEELPFPDATFDGVLLLTTLGFAKDAPAILREARRVLRPG